MNVLLTGSKQVGKTSVCQAVVELARAGGHRPQGVLSPALYNGAGARVGFEALDIGSGQRWMLAHMDRELDGPRVGPFAFDSAGLARAVEVIQAACNGAPLLVVDEIGPLELERKEGLATALDLLPLPTPGHVLLVVRPTLLPQLHGFMGEPTSIYTVTECNRDILAAHVVREFWPHD
jgi:nucleoside-triphosphatase THEP1